MRTKLLTLKPFIRVLSRFKAWVKRKNGASSNVGYRTDSSTHDRNVTAPATREIQRSRLLSLPFELLSHIFYLLCIDADGRYWRRETDMLVRTLSSVSTQFRHAVVETPLFWTKFYEYDYVKNDFEKRLSRCKNAPLQLFLNLETNGVSTAGICFFVAQFKDRWEEMRILLPWTGLYVADFPIIEFPHVYSLDVCNDYKWETHPISKKWSFPKLTTARLATCFLGKLPYSQLTSLTFVAALGFYASLREILVSLSHIHGLQFLELDLLHNYGSESGELPNVCLRRVSEAKIIARHMPVQVVRCLFSSMSMPNVKKFSLMLDRPLYEVEGEWITMLFPQNTTFPNVEAFYFSLRTGLLYTSAVARLLSTFPNVQDVVLVVPKYLLVFDASRVRLKLEYLHSATLNGEMMDLASDSDGTTLSWKDV